MLVTMMMLALAAPNPHSLDAPRKAYAACIKEFETKSLDAKMDAAAYAAALKGACTAEAAALAKALTDYDVAMGEQARRRGGDRGKRRRRLSADVRRTLPRHDADRAATATASVAAPAAAPQLRPSTRRSTRRRRNRAIVARDATLKAAR